MKALAIIALALALEAGFLLQIARSGPAATAATTRMERSVEPRAQPLAAGAVLLPDEAPCAR